MRQAIHNRLTCWLNSMDIFYLNYGSELKKYLGYKNKDTTHEYMRLEVEKRIKKDPRVHDSTVKILKHTTDTVHVNIHLTFHNGEVFEDNFVIKKGEQ